jgi:group I intron endonuclease
VKTSRQCIYVIVNIVTFDSYIGSSINQTQRWSGHLTSLRSGLHGNWKLQKAWVTHGESAFVFNVLELVTGNDEYLRQREQHYIDTLDPSYNIRKKTARTWAAGAELSPERLAKLANCTECGEKLLPKPGRRFTCSDECDKARNKRRVQSGAYREERQCAECKAPFTVSNRSKDAETCSKKCTALKWRREEREERTVDGVLMCRKNLHAIEASDPRCHECHNIEQIARYHERVKDVPRRAWSHDGPRSAQRRSKDAA